jgi:uncharacterized protein
MVSFYRIPQSKTRKFFNSLNVNVILISTNILLYLVFMILLYVNSSFIDYIAIKPSNILSGKYLWTFLTCMFMHGGIFHLFANMLSLFFIGSLVERLLGHKRYFLFYLIAGLLSSLFFVFSSIFFGGFDTYAIGASGALFGLVGLLVLLTPNLPVYVMFIPIPIRMKYAGPGILIALWLISIAPLAIGGNRIPIGNTAHLGGLVVGLIYGVYIKNKYKNKTKYIRKYFS